jgi:hypothetical protein
LPLLLMCSLFFCTPHLFSFTPLCTSTIPRFSWDCTSSSAAFYLSRMSPVLLLLLLCSLFFVSALIHYPDSCISPCTRKCLDLPSTHEIKFIATSRLEEQI